MSSKRIQIIDAARGFSIVLMIAYHFAIDLILFGLAPYGLVYNPLLNVLQPIFASVFILISGISSNFSKSNIKRGFLALLAALAVTVVTYVIGQPVYFGILHFLGCSMIIYGLVGKFIDKIPRIPALIIYIFGFVLCKILLAGYFPFRGLSWLGFTHYDFKSADYFPILPWIFMFFIGTVLGKLIKEKKFPEWFYTFKVPFFPFLGRHSLIIYLAHQPILYGLSWALSLIFT